MAKGLITHAYLEDTADAIRVLRGESNTYTPDEFGEKIIDAIPTEEVTDSIVSLTDAAAYPAEGLEFAIDPVQEGSGDPSPENIRPINGWTGVNGWRTGVNLYDGEWEYGNISELNGQNSSSSQDYFRTKNYIPIKANSVYYPFMPGRSGNYRQFYYDKNFAYLGFTGFAHNVVNDISQLSYGDKVCYMRFRVHGTFDAKNDTKISINYPATDTEYHAYTGTSISITFPTEADTVYGGKVDVVSGELTVNLIKAYLTNNDNWLKGGTQTTQGFNRYYLPQEAMKVGAAMPGYCDKLPVGNYSSTIPCVVFGYTNNSINVLSNEADITAFKAWLQDIGGLNVVYELATPIEYDITPQQVQMLLGNNNVWCDTGDTTLEYKVDLGRYIEKLQAAQTTPQLSLSRQAVSSDAPRDVEPNSIPQVLP